MRSEIFFLYFVVDLRQKLLKCSNKTWKKKHVFYVHELKKNFDIFLIGDKMFKIECFRWNFILWCLHDDFQFIESTYVHRLLNSWHESWWQNLRTVKKEVLKCLQDPLNFCTIKCLFIFFFFKFYEVMVSKFKVQYR